MPSAEATDVSSLPAEHSSKKVRATLGQDTEKVNPEKAVGSLSNKCNKCNYVNELDLPCALFLLFFFFFFLFLSSENFSPPKKEKALGSILHSLSL